MRANCMRFCVVEFQIQNFKAEYDESKKIGWLCRYYPYDAVKDKNMSEDDWRFGTYSPEILDYKTGWEQKIHFFVSPVQCLIECIAAREKVQDSFLLVPIPTSLPKNHPAYKTTPRAKGESQNRDDRNEIFCKMLVNGQAGWSTFPIISRIKEKAPKEQWSIDQQAESFGIDTDFGPLLSKTPVFLVDDVTTRHATFFGAKKIIEKIAPRCRVFCVAIGRTTAP